MSTITDSVSTTEWSPTEYQHNRAADIVYGTICLSTFVFGFTGNILSVIYFTSKRLDVSNIMYALTSVCDAVICVFAVPVGVSLLDMRSSGILFGNTIPCTVWLSLGNIVLMLSVFLVVILSCSRMISLSRPFYQIKLRSVLVAVGVFTVIALAYLIVIDVHYEFVFISMTASCVPILPHLNDEEASHRTLQIFMEVATVLFYKLPLFIVLISCIVSSVILGKASPNSSLDKPRRRASWTIILFAITFIFFNAPFVIRSIIEMICSARGDSWPETVDPLYYLGIYCDLIGPALNSLANPILYLLRFPDFTNVILRRFMPRKDRMQTTVSTTIQALTTARTGNPESSVTTRRHC